MPNTAPSPWRMFLPLAFVLLLALLWTAYWFFAFHVAKQRFMEQREASAEEGITLACTQETWGGYPFHFEFTCALPKLSLRGTTEIRSANLLMVALAYAPWQIAALIDGPSTVSAPGIGPIEISHQRALGSATFDKAGLPSVSAELPAPSVADLGNAAKIMLFTRPAAGGGTEIALQGNSMHYTPPDQAPLTVDAAGLQGTLQVNRSFHLSKFEVNQGLLRCWGSGTLALDAQRRITGRIDTETNDIGALLAQAGPLIGLSDSRLASLRTMLGLLGNGAKTAVIAKDGVLYLGPFQIAELKPLY